MLPGSLNVFCRYNVQSPRRLGSELRRFGGVLSASSGRKLVFKVAMSAIAMASDVSRFKVLVESLLEKCVIAYSSSSRLMPRSQ